MNTPLPDRLRCKNEECDVRLTCLRWLRRDDKDVFVYTMGLGLGVNECGFRIINQSPKK